MNIAFHSNQLGIRGTEVALYDYALGNEEILNNNSIILSDKNSNLEALNKFKNRFKVYLYEDFHKEVPYILDKEKINSTYYIKYGLNDGKITDNTRNLIHTVFQCYDPHGDVYSFIAQWLSSKMSGNPHNYVPHIISLPDIKEDLRKQLNIPKTSTVFGRHGGYEEFNYEWTYPIIEKIAKQRSDYYFLFLNTKPFCNSLPNIIHLPPNYDLIYKTKFINTCDALLHGRKKGEIFSLTIGEFLHQNKPIISCPLGEDEGHTIMLQDKGIWYNNENELYNILVNFIKVENEGYYKSLIKDYTCENVMNQFNKIFIKNS